MNGRAFDLCDELTLGRAAGCSVTIDDDHVSQVHARIFHRSGQLVVEDLGSLNGTYMNRARVMAPMAIGVGDRLQVGDTVLEVA
jgi:pSer/pThr/pTyr-binding forkhead associated (FHA) protein